MSTGLRSHSGASIGTLYHATAESAVQAYIDIAILDLSSTTEYLHYILVLGLVVWATSMFASYAVFGHHRPLNAVLVVGVVLLLNMSLTQKDQLPYLVMFSVASLLLLIRSHVFDEQSEWMRRRIGDPASISSVYMRGGAAFIAAAVVASFVLTQTAASAPLAGAFDGVDNALIGLSQSLSRYLPTGGSTRPIGLSFGPNATIQQVWKNSGSLAVTIRRNPTDNGVYYWRAWTYDKIDLNGWDQTTSTSTEIPADTPIFDQRADDVDPDPANNTRVTTFQIDCVVPIAINGTSWLRFLVVHERLSATCTGADGIEPLRDLIIGTFALLEHTWA